MARRNKKYGSLDEMKDCCRVEAVVSVDERGQTVLPKDLRNKHGIKTGDKLAVVSINCCGDSGCMVLLKVDRMAGMLRSLLGPVFEELKK